MQKTQLLILTVVLLCTTSIQAQKVFELMETDEVNLKEVQDEAASYFKKVGTGKGTGYKLFKRWEYHAILALQEDGSVLNKEAKAAAIRSSKNRTARSAKTLSQSNWTELGPLAMTKGVDGHSPGIGRITAIYVEPVNQQLIYIGSPGGGLWKSTNGGNSWTPLGDQFDNMDIWVIEADPTDSNTIYIGDGIGQLLKSNDGGLSFTALFDGIGALRDILINPNNTDEIYIALPSEGLYHTTNSGSSWTKVIDGDIEDVLFKPGSTSTIYACGDDFYKSTNSGVSFSKITNGILDSNRMKLAVSPSNSNYVYIVQRRDIEGLNDPNDGFGYLYRSTDSGTSFTVQSDKSSGNYIGKQAHRDMAITVSNTDSNEVHIGGLDLYKSIDGGVSFVQETEWDLRNIKLSYVHGDTEVLLYIDGTMYIGCDGGIYKSTDGGASYTDLSTGLGIQQFYLIACAASNKNLIAGGSQDNGSVITSGSSLEWLQYYGADGMDCMIDPNNENIIYGASQLGSLHKTVNGGASLTTSYITPPENGQGNWKTPLAMDPNDSNRIYAGYSNLYRHDNAGISGDWVNTSANISFDAKLYYIGTCPTNSNILYASTLTSMYKSSNITDASPTWSQLSLPANTGYMTDLAVDPYNENRVAYTTSWGYVVLSTDGGLNWEVISDDLPTTGFKTVKTIAFERSPEQGIYVAIPGVVFYRNNKIPNWTVFSTNLPNVSITELDIYYDKDVPADSRIRAATFGRGLWESPLYDYRTSDSTVLSTIDNAQESELNKISLFPNPVSTTLHIQLPTAGEKTVISIANLLGKVLIKDTFYTHNGLNLLKVNIKELPAGTYPVTILRGATTLVKKLVIE